MVSADSHLTLSGLKVSGWARNFGAVASASWDCASARESMAPASRPTPAAREGREIPGMSVSERIFGTYRLSGRRVALHGGCTIAPRDKRFVGLVGAQHQPH